jgi:hypothetical protein
MENERKFPSVKENVKGDFYVEEGCCTMCGVPHSEAPTLFGGVDKIFKSTHYQCFVKKQPTNEIELEQMLNVIACADIGCIRYCGDNSDTKRKIIEMAETDKIDWFSEENIKEFAHIEDYSNYINNQNKYNYKEEYIDSESRQINSLIELIDRFIFPSKNKKPWYKFW